MMLDGFWRARVCTAARNYLGVSWRGQGRDKRGVDCIGLIVMAYRDAGLPIEEGKVDYRNIDTRRLVRVLSAHADRLAPGAQPMPADVVLLGHLRETHVALFVDGKPLNIMHCPMYGRVVETRFDPARGAIRGIYRWRSLQ